MSFTARIRAQLPAYAKSLFRPKRYKVFWGGRGAARSWSYARSILIQGARSRLRVLCCREFQKSIDDSVHKLFADQIAMLQLPGWKVQQKSIVHRGTGTTIIFEGLRYNANRIKSMEGIDVCWVEEAESVIAENWEILIPTIRAPGSEIWISFNPDLEDDPTYQRFIVHEPPNAIVQKVGWEDNPWFHLTEMPAEKDYLYRVDPETADHVWGGFPKKHAKAQILAGKWKVEAFEVPRAKHEADGWIGPLYGCDFGFSEDPTAAVEIWIKMVPKSQGILYVNRESWKLKLDIHKIYNQWVKDFDKIISKRTIRAESARPETISYLRQHGLSYMRPTFKWPNSVEEGIAYLRSFEEIIIHPRCTHFRQECKAYSYKIDKKTGEVLTDIVDKDNHLIDSVRYALAPMIRIRKGINSGYSGHSYAGNA